MTNCQISSFQVFLLTSLLTFHPTTLRNSGERFSEQFFSAFCSSDTDDVVIAMIRLKNYVNRY